MAGGCLASRDAQSEGRSRDEDGSWKLAGMWETAGSEQTTRCIAYAGPRPSIEDMPGIDVC